MIDFIKKCIEKKWKKKAIERTKELKKLNKRLKEITESRDKWKEKAQGYKNTLEELRKNIKEQNKTQNNKKKRINQKDIGLNIQ